MYRCVWFTPWLALPTLGHVLEIWLPLDNYNICHIYSFLANSCTDLRVQNNFNQNCVIFASGKKGLWITALEPQKKIQNRFTKTVINWTTSISQFQSCTSFGHDRILGRWNILYFLLAPQSSYIYDSFLWITEISYCYARTREVVSR